MSPRQKPPTTDLCASDLKLFLTSPKPLPAYLPFHYYRFPNKLRHIIGKLIHARIAKVVLNNLAAPLPTPQTAAKTANIIWLTHDVETPAGLNAAVTLAEFESRHGIRATYFVVPKLVKNGRDKIRRIFNLGHEIGVHGYDHACRLPYLPRGEISRRLLWAQQELGEFKPRAFRSPWLARTPDLMSELESLFPVDSSLATIEPGGLRHQIWPFKWGRLIEVPLTLPMDVTLRLMRLPLEIIAEHYRQRVAALLVVGAPVVFVTHPGQNAELDIYIREILLAEVLKAQKKGTRLCTSSHFSDRDDTKTRQMPERNPAS